MKLIPIQSSAESSLQPLHQKFASPKMSPTQTQTGFIFQQHDSSAIMRKDKSPRHNMYVSLDTSQTSLDVNEMTPERRASKVEKVEY